MITNRIINLSGRSVALQVRDVALSLSHAHSLAQGLEIIYIFWLLMNFLNIHFFYFRLVYRHGLISKPDIFQTKPQEKNSFLD